MNYREYQFNRAELIQNLITGELLIAAALWTFYRNIVVVILGSPLLYLFIKYRKRICAEKARETLSMEFREALIAVQAALNAGYSIENAFIEAGHDMDVMYGKDSMIAKEFCVLVHRLRSNERLEYILMDFGLRSGVEDIKDFAEIFAVAKRSGGNLTGIINRAAGMISERMEVNREISVMISAKRYESRIMDIVPFGIIVYITQTSPEISGILYNNVGGVIMMTVCLAAYLTAFWLAEKIVTIQV
ncbi:MAG: type II secretion system F family protein [Lachnospiraceae bacterium]|nr:type II secretion system F family protein [Lachnospiraceae bacterium]